jgi:hypothetical protein
MNKISQVLLELENRKIDESSMSRIWQHIEDSNTRFGVITAYRNTRTPNENQQLQEQLKDEVRDMGYGYIAMYGGYTYDEGGKVETAKEPSIFVPNISKKEIMDLGEKYDQDSIIFKGNNEFAMISTNPSKGIGKKMVSFYKESGRDNLEFDEEKLKQFWSELAKGSHAGRKFLFSDK